MDQTPLPTLLMRTVIQALGSYPRLSGFVMNILQRLILKQVIFSQPHYTRIRQLLLKKKFSLFMLRFFTGLETKSRMGRFYKMLPKNKTTKFCCIDAVTSAAVV
jgi:hypothetical protein